MASAETAAGKYPVKAVQAMSEVIQGAEKYQIGAHRRATRNDEDFTNNEEAISMAVIYTASHMRLRAIVALLVLFVCYINRFQIAPEESALREKFGDAYDAYAQERAPKVERAFSCDRALYNREHHTMAGLAAGLLLLAAKAFF